MFDEGEKKGKNSRFLLSFFLFFCFSCVNKKEKPIEKKQKKENNARKVVLL